MVAQIGFLQRIKRKALTRRNLTTVEYGFKPIFELDMRI